MGPPAGPRRRLRLAIVLIWLVTLVGAEVASRLVLPAPGFQPWVNPHVPGLRVPHAIRGFANAPNFSGRRVTSDYEHGLVTNELGMRDEPFDDRRPGRRILAVGDSFTEGLGVEREEAWPEQLEQRLSARRPTHVWNAGVTSYSALQMRQTAAEYVPVIRPDLVIAGIYARGVTRLLDPYVLLGDGVVRRSASLASGPLPADIAIRCSSGTGWWRWICGSRTTRGWPGTSCIRASNLRDRLAGRPTLNPEHARMVTDAPMAVEPLLDEIGRLQALTHAAGIQLVVLLVNGQQADGQFHAIDQELNERIRVYAAGRDIAVVDPRAALIQAAGGQPVMRFRADGHWTPLAHRIVAAELATALERNE